MKLSTVYKWYTQRRNSSPEKGWLIFLFIIFSVGILSCSSSPALNTKENTKKTRGPVTSGSSVWKISRNGHSLFLGGSIHVLRAEDFPLPEEFDRAFSQSSLLVLETDIEKMTDENVIRYLTGQMLLPGGLTLKSVLDRDTYDLLGEKCGEYGFSIEAVSDFKPSMVISMLTMLQIGKYGFIEQGVDILYLDRAQKENKYVDYLETAEAQINMLVSMGDGYENDFVRYSLNDLCGAENDLASLLAEWKTGGALNMEASLQDMKEQWPEIYKTMVTDRNNAWMLQIEKYLASDTVPFIIVGAAHLHGPDGLLAQLKNSDCSVKQL